MYNYLDFDNDRSKVRNKFLNEVHKRSNLADIGEQLDKIVINEKAEMLEFYDLKTYFNKEIRSAKEEHTSDDFKWAGKLSKLMDPKTPLFIDDTDQIKSKADS